MHASKQMMPSFPSSSSFLFHRGKEEGDDEDEEGLFLLHCFYNSEREEEEEAFAEAPAGEGEETTQVSHVKERQSQERRLLYA